MPNRQTRQENVLRIRQVHWVRVLHCLIAVYWVILACAMMKWPHAARIFMGALTTMAFQYMVGPPVEWENEED